MTWKADPSKKGFAICKYIKEVLKYSPREGSDKSVTNIKF